MPKKKDERKKVAVRATAPGFFGGARRRVGEVFFVPEGVVGKWFAPTDPTLADKNASALEEAAKAKREAEETNRAAKIKAEQDLKDAKKSADAQMINAKKVADAQAKKSIFGNLLPGNHKVKTPPVDETEPAGDESLDGVA